VVSDEVLYRDYRGDGELVLVMPQRVVSDDERGLLTWRPIGTPFRPDFTLDRWYVNLEAPPQRWPGGVDTFDHALDIVVAPDRVWRWKDEGEYLERVGHPAYWTAEQAAEIRAEGERVVADIEAARFPFDGSWLDFRPDPAWPLPTLPSEGWDRPRVSP
jgi:hypothetical protein